MFEYTVRRLLQGVLVVFAVTIVLFIILQMMPGDAISLISDPRMAEEKKAELRAEWGLDKPLPVQYVFWIKKALQGDFGTSIVTRQNVIKVIREKLPYTFMLAGLSLILQFIIAVPLGLISAVKRGSLLDRAIVSTTIILWSTPRFWLGILLIMIFSIKLQLLPISGFYGPKSLILPLMTMTLPYLAQILRLTRSEVLDVLQEKMVVTAYAKGLRGRTVIIRHVLRNALIPTTIMFFLSLPWILGGAVVIESVFAWPGMGRLLWTSIIDQDFPVVQGIIFLIAILTVVSNTIGDVIAAYLDPRIRLGIEGETL
jgi:ABC-type dipeptide/oligopeptide/nickel transport system permease component